MATLYTTVDDFANSAIGADLQPYWNSKPLGTVDRAALAASAAVDRYCRRVLGAPPTTTVGGTLPVPAGSASVPVATAVNIHAMDVLVFPRTGEVLEVAGASLGTKPFGAYPGTVQVLSPTGNIYNPGDVVQVYRQERYEIRGKSTNGYESAFPQSQEGQMAQMHAPMLARGQSSRIIMLRQYPVLSLFAAYESLPWSNTETKVDLSSAYLKRESGFFRLPVGFYNPLSTIWRTQYSAGYAAVPYDIQDAVHLLMAEQLMRGQNPLGALNTRVDDESNTGIGQAYHQAALAILDGGNYVRSGTA